ncbi:MAG: hypothetical protein IJL71_06075 [Oscillospiraceae bacterium]|nr:hypothetical protein [Oscillospiraceae bacterium]
MEAIITKLLTMSVTGSVVILLVLAARLMLKKMPKVFSYALWAVVLFRLLFNPLKLFMSNRKPEIEVDLRFSRLCQLILFRYPSSIRVAATASTVFLRFLPRRLLSDKMR